MKRPRKFKRRERAARRVYTSKHDGCHVRCRVCQGRRTLPARLKSYDEGQAPRCKCGSRDWRVDMHRIRKEVGDGAPRPCRCPEYHFPHARGRGMCKYNDKVTEAYAAARGRA